MLAFPLLNSTKKESVNRMELMGMKRLPDYYPTMYLDGYTAEEVWAAFRNTRRKQIQERLEEESSWGNIRIISEVRVK